MMMPGPASPDLRHQASQPDAWVREGYLGGAQAAFAANLGLPTTSTGDLSSLPTSAQAHSPLASPSLPPACDSVFRTPVAVMNLPADRERRDSSHALFSRLGFVNISFPETLTWNSFDEHQEQFATGNLGSDIWQRLKWRGDLREKEGFWRYAANALSQVQRIRRAAAGGCIFVYGSMCRCMPAYAFACT